MNLYFWNGYGQRKEFGFGNPESVAVYSVVDTGKNLSSTRGIALTRKAALSTVDMQDGATFRSGEDKLKSALLNESRDSSAQNSLNNLSVPVLADDCRSSACDSGVISRELLARESTNGRSPTPAPVESGNSRSAQNSLASGVESRHAHPSRDGSVGSIPTAGGDEARNFTVKGEQSGGSGSSAPPSQTLSEENTFSGSTLLAQANIDKIRMAATVEEGTAPKLVQVTAGANVRRPNSEDHKLGVTAGETAFLSERGDAKYTGLMENRLTSSGDFSVQPAEVASNQDL